MASSSEPLARDTSSLSLGGTVLPPAHHGHISGIRPVAGPTNPSTIRQPTLLTRLISLGMLGAVTAILTVVGDSVYKAARDSFVAPAILSPDSDVSMTGKLKLSEFSVERSRIAAAIQGIDAEVAAADRGLADLDQLRNKLEKSVRFTSEVTANKAVSGSAELETLLLQRRILLDMASQQKELVTKAQADLETGVISRSDYAKETQTLSQYELELAETDRATLQRRSESQENLLTQRALSHPQDSPLTPELMVREDQKIHVQLEKAHLEAEKRSKLAERAALSERMSTIDSLTTQLKNRPAYQAANKRLEVAFVPYSQIDGVQAGARVYACVWALFFCKAVGTVSEIAPGEILLPDPWGSPQRGQYAVLDLWDHESAKFKMLRVRSGDQAAPATLPIVQK